MVDVKEFHFIPSGERAEIKRTLTGELQRQSAIIFAYLHGSFVDPAASFRDIDIALFVDPQAVPAGNFFDFVLDAAVGLSRAVALPVDAQVINYAPLGFKFSVLKNGDLLFTRNELALGDFIEAVSIEQMIFQQIAS